MVRRGMRDFLELHDDIEVVGEAADGAAGVEQAKALQPDIVVMDLMMPNLDGIEATGRIKAALPDVEVIALTSFIEESRVVAAIEAGASGFLLKDAEADELAAAIRSAAAGEVHLDPAVAAIVARRMRDGGRGSAADQEDGIGTLTARERDVLARVARGYPNRQIASDLGITERTARTHVSNILAKLGLDEPDAGGPARRHSTASTARRDRPLTGQSLRPPRGADSPVPADRPRSKRS